MKRKFAEKDLSAYLDGQLDESDTAELEEQLKQDTQLAASLEQLKKLNALVSEDSLKMPANDYFDDLAARIDDRVAAEAKAPEKAKVIRIFGLKPRTVGSLGTVAALLLIVAIISQLYEPAADKMFTPQPVILQAPAVESERKLDDEQESTMKHAEKPTTKEDKRRATIVANELSVRTGRTANQETLHEEAAIPDEETALPQKSVPKQTDLFDLEQQTARTAAVAPEYVQQIQSETAEMPLIVSKRKVTVESVMSGLQRLDRMETGAESERFAQQLESDLRALLKRGEALPPVEVGKQPEYGKATMKVKPRTAKSLSKDQFQALAIGRNTVPYLRNETEYFFQIAKESPTTASLLVARVYLEHLLSFGLTEDSTTFLPRLEDLRQLKHER